MSCNNEIEIMQKIIKAYYNDRDIDTILDCVSDDIEWIGTEKDDSARGKEELRHLLEKELCHIPTSFSITLGEPVIQKISDTVSILSIQCDEVEMPGVSLGTCVRVSGCVKKEERGWVICQVHASTPNAEDEKIQLSKKLEQKRKQVDTLMAGMPGGVAIYRLKKNGTVGTDYVSESLAKMCGYDTNEFLEYLKEDALCNLVKEDIPKVQEAVYRSISNHENLSVRYHIYSKSKEPIYIRLDAAFIDSENVQEDEYGVYYAVHTVVSNESKQIIDEQQSLKKLIDEVPTGIGIYEIDHGVARQDYMNDAFYKMIGTTREKRTQFFGENTMNAVHPKDYPVVQAAIEKMMAGENFASFQYRLDNGDNGWFWISQQASVVERKKDYIRLYSVLSDFNEVISAKNKLEASQVTLETALHTVKVSTWRYDYKQRKITDSMTLGEAYGLPKEIENGPEGMLKYGFVADESKEDFIRLFDEVEKEKYATVDIKSNRMCPTGNIWYKLIYTPVYDAQGNYVDAIGVEIDITEQKTRAQNYQEQLRLNKMSTKDALAVVSFNLSKNTIIEVDCTDDMIRRSTQGKTAEEVLQKMNNSVAETMEKEAFEGLVKPTEIIQAYKNGQSHHRIRHRLAGDARWYESTLDCLQNPYTQDIEAIVAIKDITRIVQTELLFKQLLKMDYEAIIISDITTGKKIPYHVKETAARVEELKRLEEQYGEEKGINAFFTSYATEATRERVMRENSLPYIEEQLATKPFFETMGAFYVGGKIKQYRLLYSYLGGDKNMIVSAVQDTTSMYEQEEKQKQQLSIALKEAKSANLAKTDFMNRMSHDMRTPMNAILGLSALTLDDAKNPSVVRENMNKMRQAGDFMLGLVNDILDMAKIEDGSITLHYEPYSYSDFLTNMKTMFIPQCEAKGLHIEFAEPVHIDPTGLTDKIRINQIFFNIYSNAVKYTPTGGSIKSYVVNMKKEGNCISGDYVIQDTGIGMSEEFQKHLFEAFTQEDTAVSPELQGTGLGLSITKQLVDLMGGTIKIESEKGKGTKVIVHLSFELTVQKKKEDVQVSSIDCLEGKRILLVEDHPLNAQIARKLLEKKGMNVMYAENGKIAVEMFRASSIHSVDAILMDIRMPEMSGLEATKCIRALDREDATTVPIIAMSANAYDDDIQKSLDAGMNAHLAKPVEPEKLYEAISRLVKK